MEDYPVSCDNNGENGDRNSSSSIIIGRRIEAMTLFYERLLTFLDDAVSQEKAAAEEVSDTTHKKMASAAIHEDDDDDGDDSAGDSEFLHRLFFAAESVEDEECVDERGKSLSASPTHTLLGVRVVITEDWMAAPARRHLEWVDGRVQQALFTREGRPSGPKTAPWHFTVQREKNLRLRHEEEGNYWTEPLSEWIDRFAEYDHSSPFSPLVFPMPLSNGIAALPREAVWTLVLLEATPQRQRESDGSPEAAARQQWPMPGCYIPPAAEKVGAKPTTTTLVTCLITTASNRSVAPESRLGDRLHDSLEAGREAGAPPALSSFFSSSDAVATAMGHWMAFHRINGEHSTETREGLVAWLPRQRRIWRWRVARRAREVVFSTLALLRHHHDQMDAALVEVETKKKPYPNKRNRSYPCLHPGDNEGSRLAPCLPCSLVHGLSWRRLTFVSTSQSATVRARSRRRSTGGDDGLVSRTMAIKEGLGWWWAAIQDYFTSLLTREDLVDFYASGEDEESSEDDVLLERIAGPLSVASCSSDDDDDSAEAIHRRLDSRYLTFVEYPLCIRLLRICGGRRVRWGSLSTLLIKHDERLQRMVSQLTYWNTSMKEGDASHPIRVEAPRVLAEVHSQTLFLYRIFFVLPIALTCFFALSSWRKNRGRVYL